VTTTETTLPLGDNPPVLLLTNRWNLVEILSSGLILPPTALRKYYRDLMQLANGWVPVLRSPVGQDTVDLVVVEDPANAFPVALEPQAVPAGAAVGPTDEAGRTLAWATDKVLTLASVRTVHFRSQDDREEHELREYDNVVAAVATAISPHLFAASERHAEALQSWLGSLEARSFGSGVNALLDRLAGGILGAVAVPDGGPGLAVAVQTASTLREAVPTGEAVADALAEVLAGESGDKGAEGVLLTAVLGALAHVDAADAWNPVAVLDDVGRRVAGDESVTARIARNLAPIRLVLKNERDFNRFKPGAGLTGAKAFFLVLMRPELDRLISWDVRDTGATPVIRAVAAFLSGFLRGRTLLSRDARPDVLDGALRDMVAACLNGEPSPHQIGTAAVDGATALTVDGSPAVTADVSDPPLGALLRSRAPLDETGSSLALSLATAEGWDDCIRTTIETSGELTVSALGRGRTRISVVGAPTVTGDVDVERLATQTDAESPGSEAAVELRNYLASQQPTGPPTKKSRRRRK
jgi:hypothetical protein